MYASTTDSGGPRREADFQKLTQTITKSIQKIIQNVSSMQRMVNQFGTAQDSPELKQQFRQIRTYTQQLLTDTEHLVRDLDDLLKDSSNSKDRHLKIQRDRLVDEFTSAITSFQTVQRKNVDFEKNAIRQAKSQANYTIAKPPGTNHHHSSSHAGPFEDNFVSGRQQSQTQIQEEIDLQSLEEQEQNIRELEENIAGVNEIYKNLGALVYEQGHMVDSIEASVEQTTVFVSEGTEQLKKANQYKNKVMRKKLYLGLILFAVLAVIILIVWLSN